MANPEKDMSEEEAETVSEIYWQSVHEEFHFSILPVKSGVYGI